MQTQPPLCGVYSLHFTCMHSVKPDIRKFASISKQISISISIFFSSFLRTHISSRSFAYAYEQGCRRDCSPNLCLGTWMQWRLLTCAVASDGHYATVHGRQPRQKKRPQRCTPFLGFLCKQHTNRHSTCG
jgi:hypothetical protein